MGKRLRLFRRQLQKILLYGEGQTDEAFLRHLSSLYCPRRCGKNVDHDNAHGGGADGAAKKALQTYREISYAQKIILLDSIPILSISRRDVLKNNGWVIFVSEPCIEGLFLDILEPRQSHRTWSTNQCETEFHYRYLDQKEATDYKSYKKYFPQDKIDKASKQIKIIEKILRILQS